MIDISKGRYWDKPLSLVSGCTPCSPGCEKCWSASMTHRFKHPKSDSHIHDGLMTDDSGRFTGVIYTHPERLSIPLKRRKPTVYAVWNDLFHDDVPWDFIYDAYEKMASCPRHAFLILTKRPQRMVGFIEHYKARRWKGDYDIINKCFDQDFSHIYHGLTVCNPAEADEKIPRFLQVPGKKFLSIEPMLSSINFRWTPYHHQATGETYRQYLERKGSVNEYESLKQINTVILGGETGPGARPMHPDWVRSVRDQCAAAGVDFFFKGWGKHVPTARELLRPENKENEYSQAVFHTTFQGQKAGRLLDGRTHDDLPWVKE